MEEQNTESWKKDASKYKMVIKLVYRFKTLILILINYETQAFKVHFTRLQIY